MQVLTASENAKVIYLPDGEKYILQKQLMILSIWINLIFVTTDTLKWSQKINRLLKLNDLKIKVVLARAKIITFQYWKKEIYSIQSSSRMKFWKNNNNKL